MRTRSSKTPKVRAGTAPLLAFSSTVFYLSRTSHDMHTTTFIFVDGSVDEAASTTCCSALLAAWLPADSSSSSRSSSSNRLHHRDSSPAAGSSAVRQWLWPVCTARERPCSV